MKCLIDDEKGLDRWVYGRTCRRGTMKKIKKEKSSNLDEAKLACENACNLQSDCYFANLYYNENRKREICYLKSEKCKDRMKYDTQVDKYFYRKGILSKIFIYIRCLTLSIS